MTVETPSNTSPENKAHFLAEKEAIHLILTGIALAATAHASQDPFYLSSRSYRSQAPSPKPLIPSRSYISTRHKGKEIAKPLTPPSETASEEDSDPKQARRDKDMQKNLTLISKYFKRTYKPTNNNLRASSNFKDKNVDTSPWYKNDDHSGQFGTQRTVNVAGTREKVRSQPKRVKDFAYHKEKMLLCKQAEQGVPLQAEQYDWLADTNEEVDEQELEAHYSYMAKIQENEQNDVESDDERVALANLKLDVDEIKKIQKQLKKANTALAQELKECKAILAETKIDELKSEKAEFPDMYDVILHDCVSKDVMCSYLQSLSDLDALAKLQCMYFHKIQKQLKKLNTTLAQEVKECKTILAKTSKSQGKYISVRDNCLVALQTKQAEFEKFKAFNDRTIDYDKLKRVNHKPNVSRP
nr:hypothetical protein [Tanacetum cinerariifolium]